MAEQPIVASILDINPWVRALVLPIVRVIAITVVALSALQAQTFQVLHDFTGGQDGGHPFSGVSMDAAGTLYGITGAGGYQGNNCNNINQYRGCGVAYKLARQGSGWLFRPLYQFQGSPDGGESFTRLIPGPDGAIYGATFSGGPVSEFCPVGCGTVFKLTPPASFCRGFQCNWVENQLHVFSGTDGYLPTGEITFDASGHLYGTTAYGGSGLSGTVYELTPTSGLWTQTTLHNFTGEPDGQTPQSGVQLDGAGNVYGTTNRGGYGSNGGNGLVFQLVRAQGWQLNPIYVFQPQGPFYPWAGVTLDVAGNLYGTTTSGDPGAIVFQLSRSNGNWLLNTLYTFSLDRDGPVANLTMDAAGNLYGTSYNDGSDNYGTVFKLTPSDGGWIYTRLHDFTGGRDGGYPYSNVLIDANGNMFGTASVGGTGNGTVWEITP